MQCPCSPHKLYANCCEPYHLQKMPAPTAETLMRSRYSAYTLQKIDYIVATMSGKAAEGFNFIEALEWSRSVKWLRLRVLSAREEGTQGFVEFKAIYLLQGQRQCIHELSEFHLSNGKWFYVDGQLFSNR